MDVSNDCLNLICDFLKYKEIINLQKTNSHCISLACQLKQIKKCFRPRYHRHHCYHLEIKRSLFSHSTMSLLSFIRKLWHTNEKVVFEIKVNKTYFWNVLCAWIKKKFASHALEQVHALQHRIKKQQNTGGRI